jgi:hypothetical protein
MMPSTSALFFNKIATDANEFSAVQDMRRIEQDNAAKPDGVVDSELRAESAAREPNS